MVKIRQPSNSLSTSLEAMSDKISSHPIIKKITAPVKGALINPYALGNALGIVSLFTLLFYAVMDWFSLEYSAQIIFDQYPIAFSSDWTILLGFLQTYVLGYITGWLIAKIYNYYS